MKNFDSGDRGDSSGNHFSGNGRKSAPERRDSSRGFSPDGRGNRNSGNRAGAYENKSREPRRDTAFRAPLETPVPEGSDGVIVGRNAVKELLAGGRAVDKIFVSSGDREGSITVLVAEAIARGIPVIEAERRKLDTLACGERHQGIVAMAAEKEYVSVDDLLEIAAGRGEAPFLVIADKIEDPYNLGAMIRCAEGAGAHGLIIPKRHATGLSAAVTKSSAGAIEHMAVAKVANIAQTVDYLKEKGVWTYAAEAGGQPFYEHDYKTGTAVVFGSEGDGVSPLVKQKCDFAVSIPMYGKVTSFNVSTASAVILCEVAKQRHPDKI